MNQPKTIVLFIICIVTMTVMGIAGFRAGRSVGVDERTKELCLWYAKQDHNGEIGKERLEKMGYIWTDFNWYESCLINNGIGGEK